MTPPVSPRVNQNALSLSESGCPVHGPPSCKPNTSRHTVSERRNLVDTHSMMSASSRKRAFAAKVSVDDLIHEPSIKDVVLGRGSAQSWRPGNVYFHDLLDDSLAKYQQKGLTKKSKREIIRGVYTRIEAQGGRFLEKHSDSDQYIEVDEDAALMSIGYAMRYRKKRIRKAEADLAQQVEEASTNGRPTIDFDDWMASKQPPSDLLPRPQKRQKEEKKRVSSAHLLPPPPPNHRPANHTSGLEIISDEDLRSVLDHVNNETQPRQNPPQNPPYF
mmetsp:Transcript_26483/g.50010  ORF Transcript_26483/g.50010 Transcript_26483/m.50010 type:complete len:274 (+) Transcript_26483:64-885(+)|eukprot:scaffold2974_cov181-Amphora_coffeaeformis.AAC.16